VRLNLSLGWVADRVAGGGYLLNEPPSAPQPWVRELGVALRLFRDRLAQVGGVGWSGVVWGL
jgi:hypothetical protein